MPISIIDLVLLIPLAWGAYIGFKKGLILELASLIALALGIYGAVKFSDLTAAYLVKYVNIEEQWLSLSSFIVTFLLIVIAVFLLSKLIDKLLKMVALGLVNRLLGLLFGLLKYALILSVLLFLFETLNQRFAFVEQQELNKSLLYEPVQQISKPLLPFFTEFIPEQLP